MTLDFCGDDDLSRVLKTQKVGDIFDNKKMKGFLN